MSRFSVVRSGICGVLAVTLGMTVPLSAQIGAGVLSEERQAEIQKMSELSRRPTSTMPNPYRMLENWPTLPAGMEWGAAIGIIPDDTGGTWMLFRSEPPVLYINADGQVTKSFGEGTIVQAHGFCMDQDENLWAGDSGPFGDDPSSRGRGFQIHKFSQDGELLMSLGQAGVSRADEADTFIGPTACTVAPDGNIIIADGHWPRPSTAQQDGDRIVVVTPDGEFVREVGRLGAGPGEFMGPHSLALDADGRLFVADRSNNRIQILDRNLNFVDDWRHFGRPSGVTVLDDGTLVVSDSESGAPIPGRLSRRKAPQESEIPDFRSAFGSGAWTAPCSTSFPAPGPREWQRTTWGNIFAGLAGGCDASPSGGCLQKWVPADSP